MTRSYPRAANSVAMARPMPRLLPVIRATGGGYSWGYYNIGFTECGIMGLW